MAVESWTRRLSTERIEQQWQEHKKRAGLAEWSLEAQNLLRTTFFTGAAGCFEAMRPHLPDDPGGPMRSFVVDFVAELTRFDMRIRRDLQRRKKEQQASGRRPKASASRKPAE